MTSECRHLDRFAALPHSEPSQHCSSLTGHHWPGSVSKHDLELRAPPFLSLYESRRIVPGTPHHPPLKCESVAAPPELIALPRPDRRAPRALYSR